VVPPRCWYRTYSDRFTRSASAIAMTLFQMSFCLLAGPSSARQPSG